MEDTTFHERWKPFCWCGKRYAHCDRYGALKSDSTHHFFRNACTKSGPLRFSQFSGCWLILSVYILVSFDFPFVRFKNFTYLFTRTNSYYLIIKILYARAQCIPMFETIVESDVKYHTSSLKFRVLQAKATQVGRL
jgi:hypothetical protein